MKKFLLSLAIVAAGCLSASAQSRGGLRINEVMVENGSSIVDEYGQRAGWIELFNSTYAPLQISSVYLTNDSTNPKMYPVPLGDEHTVIGKRQHVIFWADNRPTNGTFHTNFTLTPGQDNWIGVYDANGVTLIDSVTIPASLLADQTWARVKDGVKETGWTVKDGSAAHYITPSSNNVINDTNSKVEQFEEKDRNGFALSIMAMCIVFSTLLLLCICFILLSKLGSKITRRNKMKAQGLNPETISREDHPENDSGEVIAAISMALHDHLDAHDAEQTILTINKVKKAYSPWSSKIYSMREIPSRK